MYRSFNPQNGISQREKFKYQLSIIKEAFTKGTIILGDFNLDYFKKHSVNYTSSRMFEDFEEKLSDLDLIQLVRCNTWSRIVNNIFRESLLDHIYVNDPTICNDVTTLKPCFGDHMLVMVELNLSKLPASRVFSRDWRKYSKDALCTVLNDIIWN